MALPTAPPRTASLAHSPDRAIRRPARPARNFFALRRLRGRSPSSGRPRGWVPKAGSRPLPERPSRDVGRGDRLEQETSSEPKSHMGRCASIRMWSDHVPRASLRCANRDVVGTRRLSDSLLKRVKILSRLCAAIFNSDHPHGTLCWTAEPPVARGTLLDMMGWA